MVIVSLDTTAEMDHERRSRWRLADAAAPRVWQVGPSGCYEHPPGRGNTGSVANDHVNPPIVWAQEYRYVNSSSPLSP